MAVNPVPEGYSTVTPYLAVQGVEGLIEFVKKAFDAEERFRMAGPDGRTNHAEMKIGDSIVMMGEPNDPSSVTKAMLYLYLGADVDGYYRKALEAGATSVREPENQMYGDRTAAVQDPTGNYWWIAAAVEEVSYEEMQRRIAESSSGGES